MIGNKQEEKGFVTVATKVSESMAHTLNLIARKKGIKVYELMQLVCWFLVKYTSDQHNLDEDIQKLMIMFHSEAGWKDAFNLCNPTAETEVAEEILILQQEGKRGFGAVKVEKPFMGQWRQTENVTQIVERVIEVCLPDVYRRLRLLATNLECNSIAETLITLSDAQTIEWLNEQNRREMEDATRVNEYGNVVEYGHRTRRIKHRTIDSVANSHQTIKFDESDVPDLPELQDNEGEFKGNSDDGLIDGIRPHGVEY